MEIPEEGDDAFQQEEDGMETDHGNDNNHQVEQMYAEVVEISVEEAVTGNDRAEWNETILSEI